MMSSEEESKEEVICAVCSKFEPQAWRKKFCRNCFHSLEEHSGDGEKESGSEQVENEKNLKKTEEKKSDDGKITKDKSIKDSPHKNKYTDKPSSKDTTPKPTENSSSKDTTPKQTDKTSALADKISKKLTGSTDKEKDKKIDEKVKTDATDKLKNKFEIISKTEKPSDKKDAKQLDDNQSKSDKTKTVDKSKFEAKITEDKASKNSVKTADDETKPGLKTFKVPEKQDTKMKWKNMWGSTLAKKDDKSKVDNQDCKSADTNIKDDKTSKSESKTSEESGIKDSIKAKFESKDTGSLWGVSKPLEKKTDRSSVERKTADDKVTSTEKSKEKESEKYKIDDKKTAIDKSNVADKNQPKENEKSKFGNKIQPKENEKSKFGDKNQPKESEKLKFGDKNQPKESEKSKFGDKNQLKESEKSKFGDKQKETETPKFGDKSSTKDKFDDKNASDKGDKFGVKLKQKETDKTKFSENVTSKEPEKSKFGDKIKTKEPVVSKFGDKITPKETEKIGDKISSNDQVKSKFGDKISSKDSEKAKFGDKLNSKEQEKSKFGDKSFDTTNKSKPAGETFTLKERDKANTSDKGNLKSNEKEKSNIETEKQKAQGTKTQEKSKIDELKSKIDSKTNKFGQKSKLDKNEDKSSNKGKLDEKTTKAEMESDNQKNEKLEGKLKLDIKKAEKANKFDKENSPVSQTLAERLKDKYEKISKTPTSTTPGKNSGQKSYGRSKSDGAVIQDKLPEKTGNIMSPKMKPPSSTSTIEDKLSSLQPLTDDKKSELLQKEAKLSKKGGASSDKTTKNDVKEFTDVEVKDIGETTQSNEQSLPKLNTDDINKIKEAAKFLLDDDFDDARYNSLGRRNSGNKSTPQETSLSSSATQQADDKKSGAEHSVQGKTVKSNTTLEKEKNGVDVLFNEKFSSETERLKKQLKQMEERCSELEEENKNLKNGLQENEKHSVRLMKQKQDVENSIKVLQKSLSSIESKCSKLETENSNLIERIKIAQAKCEGNSAMELKAAHSEELAHLRERLHQGELIVEELRDDNETLKQEILDLKGEMEEMYDTFRDQEAEEFRDVQREMEMHAKNCRVLSFKLRKYERVTEQMEAEKENYEDKIQALQNQISDGEIRAHIRDIEDELRLAKEVSVRLHDELDILEEKKCKCEDENQQLTQILEQSDKKQFRLEMEVDKLRDQVTELKKKVSDKSTPGTPVSSDDIKDRRTLIGRIGQQGSQEQDISQLTRDLFDSMERETDLKDQLQFAEQEIKDLRKKKDELEEENDNLSVQLKKMSVSKVTKYKENKKAQDPDLTEEEIELKVQLELNEQELMVAKRKNQDMENENEKLMQQIKQFKDVLAQKDQQLAIPQPPRSPNTYYEEKMIELNYEADELKWKIIEKDREIEKLSAEVSFAQTRHGKIRKSRSLETDYFDHFGERKKHLDLNLSENADSRDKTISEVRSSPEQLVRNILPTLSETPERNSPEDGTCIPIPTQFYSRSKPRGDYFKFEHQTMPSDSAEQLASLQNKIDNLQKKIVDLEKENLNLKEKQNVQPEVSQGETREELMEKILDMEEDVDILNTKLKKKDIEIKSLQTEVASLKKSLDNTETVFRRKELELLRDLDIAQEKNDILSNLLDIVKERADNAEAELERFAEENRSGSETSENSARTVSVLSDVSFGSDEVFVEGASRGSSTPGSPETAARKEKRLFIQKDWEGQFRKRVHCLERILAEERQKLAATEKKLALVSTETLSSAMSDDAKLHEREKEILQGELQETKKHLRIASDQITGLKERINSLEDENNKLKNSSWINEPGPDDDDSTPSGSVDTVLSLGTPSGSIDTVLSVGSGDKISEQFETDEQINKLVEENGEICTEENDMEYFRQRVASLEARLEESNDIWKSKSSATEKEKMELETDLAKMTELCDELREALNTYKVREDKSAKQNKEYASTIKDKISVIERKDEILQEREDIIKQREDDLQQLLDQISQRDNNIRELRESIRSRDERLKEKDEILQNLNMGSDEKQEEINYLTGEMSDNKSIIKEKDDKIKELEEKIHNYEHKNKESNIQIENERLHRELEDMAFSIGKVHTDNNTLQTEMEKTKQALSEAMVLWNKDRSTLGQELTVAREKLTMFQETFDKKESQAAQLLRKEAHKYLEQKEKLQHELRVSRVEHDANIRTLKKEKIKLQDELTQTIRQLTAEMSSNDKMAADLERLKAQEMVAYQIQHHEKVLRAEYMAMKVRFETRLENLQKEHTRLLTILDQMQHEKVLNQEIIKGIQKQMSMMKENYHKDIEKSKKENEMMERHIKELEGARELAKDLQSKMEELKRQLEDQEYERAELVDKITAERCTWEIEKSNRQSKINQLEERLAMINNVQSRTKDMQSRMEVAWNKERTEQKRLLQEAHHLALDLQQQLKSRDEEHLQEKRVLLEQLKVLRKQLDEEQISHREQISKQGTRDEQLSELERKLKDVQNKTEREHEMSLKDQADLVRRLGEMRRQHKRDQRIMEDVLSGLTRLRELASIVVASENNGEIPDGELEQRLEILESSGDSGAAASEETRNLGDIRQRINDVVLKYIKEALKEIYFAAENIARPREISDEERKQLRRCVSNEVKPQTYERSLSSSELDSLKDDFVTETLGSKELEFLKQKYGSSRPESPMKYQRSVSGTDVNGESHEILPSIHMGSMADRKQNIMYKVHEEQGLKTKFPDPPPSFLLPRCVNATRSTFSSSQTVTVHTKETINASTKQFPKSISIDTCLLSSSKMSPQGSSSSSSHSPIHFESTPCNFKQVLTPIPVTHIVPSKHSLSASTETVTPRTARKQFFAGISSEPTDHSPWPTRSRSHDSVSRKEKEIVHDLLGTPCSNGSNLTVHDEYVSLKSDTDDNIQSNDEDVVPSLQEIKNDKKKQRKAAKRSISLDSTSVKGTLAKAGVSVMSPAAPSALSPSEIFASLKRKLKPNIKRSSSLSEKELHSVAQTTDKGSLKTSTKTRSAQDMRNTFEPPLSGIPPKTVLIPPPTPPISTMQRKMLPKISDDIAMQKRSREDKKDKNKKRPRSKSAERAKTGPSSLGQPIIHQDLIPSSKLLGFETSV